MHRRRALEIFRTLEKSYPEDVTVGVPFENPFEALILTILSAQTTDRQVGMIRDTLFRRFPTPRDLAGADTEEVESVIRSTGYYHVKAKNIVAAARMILEDFHGEVPRTFPELLDLPGVGRKTANIVLSRAFGIHAGIAVDTHVFRVSRRIGFSDGTTAENVEQDLVSLFPPECWGEINALFITHGRRICSARKPKCDICPVCRSCRYYKTVVRPKKGLTRDQ